MGTAPFRDVEVIQFGELEVSRAERLLLRNGRIVALQARPFDLLLYLIDNRERVISRDELLRTVWRGVRVNEQALRFAVHAVRRAIGDSGHLQHIIRTVRGSGLQFTAAVRILTRSIDHASGYLPAEPDCSFLGRESFMASVERSLSAVASGIPRTLLASGEAGIGKTTALLRAATLASYRGFRVASARCAGTDQAPALWPWTQVLRRLLEDEPRSWLAETMRDGADAITWVLPEFQNLVPQSMNTATSDARVSRYRLFQGVHRLISTVSDRSPLALFLDDLHEADHVSLMLFDYLASQLIRSNVLLFGTFRSGDAYQKCATMVSSLLRLPSAELVTFAGLTEREVAAIAESRSGTQPSAEAVRSILAKTNGNPFFVLQVLKVLESDGRLETLAERQPLEYSIPREVRDAIRRQTDALPPIVSCC